MWFVWLLAFIALCLIGVIVFWIFSKIWIAIKRDEKRFQREYENVEEKEDA